MNYKPQDYIQPIENGMRGFGTYKFRVLDKEREYPTHHAYTYKEAVHWFNKCVERWEKEERVAQPVITASISRGLENVVKSASFSNFSSSNPQDEAEFENALIWIERYVNFYKQITRK